MKILTLDIGGTYIKFATADEQANFLSRGKIFTPLDSHENFLQTIVELFKLSDAEGIAISLPGVIDSVRGFCVTSGAIKHNKGKFIVDELQQLCKVKVTIENDANCAAIAEAKIGSLADVSDGFVMVFGTAVGGAFIKNKKLHRGKNFIAGEVSYTFNDGDELEFFGEQCSVKKILRDYTLLKNLPERISGEVFFDKVELGEVEAQNLLDKFCRKIAVKIFNLNMILDVEKFAIGGGISERKIFIDAINLNLKNIYFEVGMNFPRVEVVPCKFRNDANLIGALFNFLE